MSFRSEIMAIKLRTNRIIVVLETKIFVYNFQDLKLLDHIGIFFKNYFFFFFFFLQKIFKFTKDTFANPRGLCTLNTEGD